MITVGTISALLAVYGTGRMNMVIPITHSVTESIDILIFLMRIIVLTGVSLLTCSCTGRLCRYNTVIPLVTESIYSLCITVSTVFVTGNCFITGVGLNTCFGTGRLLGYCFCIITVSVISVEGGILTEGTDIIKIISA